MEFKDTMLAEIIIVDDVKVLFYIDYDYEEEYGDEHYSLKYKIALNGIELEKKSVFSDPELDVVKVWEEISDQFEDVAFKFVEESKGMIESLLS